MILFILWGHDAPALNHHHLTQAALGVTHEIEKHTLWKQRFDTPQSDKIANIGKHRAATLNPGDSLIMLHDDIHCIEQLTPSSGTALSLKVYVADLATTKRTLLN